MDGDEQVPDWLQPGSEVVVVSGRNDVPSPVLTVDRVLKRDIVLSNGDRWSRKRLDGRGSYVRGTSGGPWDPTPCLYPADAEAVAIARRRQHVRACNGKAVSLAHALLDDVRKGDWDDARARHERLGAFLRFAPDWPEAP